MKVWVRKDDMRIPVLEHGKEVGYITERLSGWYEFVAGASYWATGAAAVMAEETEARLETLIARLRKAGLEVKS